MIANSCATGSVVSLWSRCTTTSTNGSPRRKVSDQTRWRIGRPRLWGESSAIPDLRTNPLMLALMCILYRGVGYLPRNKAEVYEQCANLLFHKWDARRRIHADLRAGYLLEPVLRHLAWWLFVRDQVESAVTERELIDETAMFLYGRGFESESDARDAAKEFVDFARGRMWVFSDIGTTARVLRCIHLLIAPFLSISLLQIWPILVIRLSASLEPSLLAWRGTIGKSPQNSLFRSRITLVMAVLSAFLQPCLATVGTAPWQHEAACSNSSPGACGLSILLLRPFVS